MGKTYTQFKGSFQARDAQGNTYTINIYTDITESAHFGGTSTVEGFSTLRTEQGLAVNREDKGKYTLVVGGIPLTSDDPKAP